MSTLLVQHAYTPTLVDENLEHIKGSNLVLDRLD